MFELYAESSVVANARNSNPVLASANYVMFVMLMLTASVVVLTTLLIVYF